MKRTIDLLKAIQTFLLVVEKSSFSGAARELNLAASAVSRQVSDLEAYYDCQLMYRTTRSMSLTAEGTYYLEQFKEVLAQLNQLESHAFEQQQKVAGHLRITTPMNIHRLGIQNDIKAFISRFPDIKLSWLLLNRYVNLIEEGIDLALRVGPLEDSGLVARRYGEIHVSFVASPEYLREHGSPKHPEDLKHHNCLLDSSTDQPGRWSYQQDGQDKHVTVNGSMAINSGQLIADFAARGTGIALLPDFLVANHLLNGNLKHVLEEFVRPPVPLFLVYPANRLSHPGLQALVQHLLDSKRQL